MTPSFKGTTHYRNVFRRVSKKTLKEDGSEFSQVVGGSLEFSAFSDVKVSGSLDFKGFEAPDSRDLVRVYHVFEKGNGELVERPLATLMFSVSDPKYRGVLVSGTMECQSVLAYLSSKRYGAPFTIEAGVQAIRLAVELIESVGLKTNNPDLDAYTVKQGATIKKEEANYLSIVNKLLSLAGYASAWVDAYGVVQITPYREPLEREVSLVLSDEGEEKIMYPDLVRRDEWASTPNVVKVYYESETEALVATASNVDPESPASLPYRGFEVTDDSKTVTELEGATQAARLANLEKIAEKELADKTANVEYVDGSCLYDERIMPNNAVGIEYTRAGLSWRGAFTNVKLALSKAMRADYSARRFIRKDIKVEKKSEVLWEVAT